MFSELTIAEMRAHQARLELLALRKREIAKGYSRVTDAVINAGKAARALEGRAKEWAALIEFAEQATTA